MRASTSWILAHFDHGMLRRRPEASPLQRSADFVRTKHLCLPSPCCWGIFLGMIENLRPSSSLYLTSCLGDSLRDHDGPFALVHDHCRNDLLFDWIKTELFAFFRNVFAVVHFDCRRKFDVCIPNKPGLSHGLQQML